MSLGTRALRYELAIFTAEEETPAAVCRFTHDFVDAATRKGVALTGRRKAAIVGLAI